MEETRFKRFLILLEEIDRDYGFGPNEVIDDASKLNQYIDNFLEYSKQMKVYNSYFTKLYENESKSIAEKLNEI